jgi:hypothetical protein
MSCAGISLFRWIGLRLVVSNGIEHRIHQRDVPEQRSAQLLHIGSDFRRASRRLSQSVHGADERGPLTPNAP